MNGKVKILFFCMIFVAGPGFSQKIPAPRQLHPLLFYYKQAGLLQAQKSNSYLTAPVNKKERPSFSFLPALYSLPVLRADYYTSHFGFFCKKELQLQKITKVPFKFRLGSVEQCDWLEGKTAVVTK